MREEKVVVVEKGVEAVSAELLSIKTLKEGMTIMGCVKEIKQTALVVCLPGSIEGNVDVSSISESYTNVVKRFVESEQEKITPKKNENDLTEEAKNENEYIPLHDLFSIGQIVCAKVQSITLTNGLRAEIGLSLKPNDIHGEINHKTICKGMLLSVGIAERGDHGYVIETGIKNLRGFLPDGNLTTEYSTLKVGGIYYCYVKSIQLTATASTAIFTLKKIKMNAEPNADHLVPGMFTTFKVTKILKNGIQGSIFDGSLNGYINEHQLGFKDETNTFAEPKDFQEKPTLKARVLYIMPLTKLVYLSLFTQDKFIVDDVKLPIGKVIKDAKVSHIGTSGIILNLGTTKAKGVINLRSLKKKLIGNFDQDEILTRYAPLSKHVVRIVSYDPIDLLYICTDDEKAIDEKYFTPTDVKIGELIKAKFVREISDGRIEFSIGTIKAFIEPLFQAPGTKSTLKKKNLLHQCRVIAKSQRQNHVFLTNRKEFLDETASVIPNMQNIQYGSSYLGVVKNQHESIWTIEFFNYIRGLILRKDLKITELIAAERLTEGSIHEFVVKGKKKNKNENEFLLLGLSGLEVKIGTVAKAKVSQVNENGIEVALVERNVNGFVPIMYLSNFPSLVHAMHRSFDGNEDVQVVGISKSCYSLRDTKSTVKSWSKILPGDIITAFVKDVSAEVIKVQCLIENTYNDVLQVIHYKMFLENPNDVANINLVPDQKIFVKILSRDSQTTSLTLSARLCDVWSGNLLHTITYFTDYFNDIELIQKALKRNQHPITKYSLGEIVKATAVTETDTKELCDMLIDGSKVPLILTAANRLPIMGKKSHDVLIIWIDYVNCVVYGSVKKTFLDRSKQIQDEKIATKSLFLHRGLKADVALILDELIVLYPRKFTNKFIFVPTRFHYNDFQPIIKKGIHEGLLVNVTMLDISNGKFIGLFEHLYRLYENKCPSKLESLKRKAVELIEIKEEIKDEQEDVEMIDITEAETPPKKKKKKSQTVNKSQKGKKNKKNEAKISQLDGVADLDTSDDSDDDLNVSRNGKLPGVSNFWSNDLNVLDEQENDTALSSSDESLDNDENDQAKTKKLSSHERFEQVQAEEARIRAIEKCYANDSVLPTTVDQFDRWLMAEPNNSRAWIHYMAFHVQATEIDRARAIARKALKTINIREDQERLNVWAAMLNLELRFGNSELFIEVLKEALQVNEPFKIYSICLQIYTDCKRVSELCDLILTITKKFRQDPECWLKSAQAYFQIDLPDKAKALLARALQTLPERERKIIS